MKLKIVLSILILTLVAFSTQVNAITNITDYSIIADSYLIGSSNLNAIFAFDNKSTGGNHIPAPKNKKK